jgi:hypothetical protein
MNKRECSLGKQEGGMMTYVNDNAHAFCHGLVDIASGNTSTQNTRCSKKTPGSLHAFICRFTL